MITTTTEASDRQGLTTYCSSYFARRHKVILPRRVWNNLTPLSADTELPRKYYVIIDNYDTKERIPELSLISWQHAIATAQPIELTIFRHVLDSVRRRDMEFYDDWYQPNCFVLEIDMSRPGNLDSLPSWALRLIEPAETQ